jgi:hypothetical protein
MVAGLVGLEDGMEEALVGGALGALAGALIGAAIGAVVAGGNHLTARLARREPTAPLVALAPHEIYANGQYFRGNGSYRYIEDTHLDAGPPVILTVNIWSPKIRGISAEEWEIVVPDDRADEVEEIRAQLAAGHGSDS